MIKLNSPTYILAISLGIANMCTLAYAQLESKKELAQYERAEGVFLKAYTEYQRLDKKYYQRQKSY